MMKTNSYLSQIALGSLLASALVTSAQAQFSTYTSSGNGVWSAALNWSNGAPNGAGSIAFVGPHMDAENTRVAFNENVTLNRLLITDGMHVDTNGDNLTVLSDFQIGGLVVTGSNIVNGVARPTQLIVDAEGNFSVLNVEDASFEEGAQLYLSDFGGAIVNVGGTLEIDSESSIEGGGFLSFPQAGATINNNGTIRPEAGETISFGSGMNNTVNLDGSDHTGTLSALALNSEILVNGQLTNGHFDGTLEIGRASRIQFERDVICGTNSPARIILDSNTLFVATLGVGDDHTFWMGGGSDMDTIGRCQFIGDFRMFGDDTTLDISAARGGILRLTGTSDLLGGLITVAGTLDFDGGVGQSDNTGFVLNGGTVEAMDGSIITIDGPNLKDRLRGHGLWQAGIRNETSIQAEGGLLTVDVTDSPGDFDGASNEGVIRATSGDLTLIQPFGNTQFRGRAVVGNGHTLTVENPAWTFTEESQLILGGDEEEEGGILEAPNDITINGQFEVSANSEIRTGTTFGPDGSFEITEDLLLTGNSSFRTSPQAEFMGHGRVKIGKGSSLFLDEFTTFDTQLENEGRLVLKSGDPAHLRVKNSFATSGDLVIDILGGPNTTDWDQVVVDGPIEIGGTLQIFFGYPNAQLGDTWRVVWAADGIQNLFPNFEFIGTPAGTALVQFKSADSIYVKLVPESLSYPNWAAQQGLQGNDASASANPDGDPMNNLMEMFVGGDPLVAEHDLQPQFTIVDVKGVSYPAITFRQAAHSQELDLITFKVQVSSGLDDWDFAKSIEVKSEYDSLNCVNIWTFRSEVPMKDNPRQFLRLTLNLPQMF